MQTNHLYLRRFLQITKNRSGNPVAGLKDSRASKVSFRFEKVSSVFLSHGRVS